MYEAIVRWNLGDVSKEGLDCLQLSIEKFQNLHKNYSFDYYVFYNGIKKDRLKNLKNVKIISKSDYKNSLLIPPPHEKHDLPAWKLYPPRVDKNKHEIIIDNDIVIFNKINYLDDFLKNKIVYITEAKERAYSGKVEPYIPKKFHINSGFICLPPEFDLQKKINDVIKDFNIKTWDNHKDEQAIIGYIFSQMNNLKLISITDIFVCYDYILKNAKFGYHFTGLNKNKRYCWHKYLNKSYKNLKI